MNHIQRRLLLRLEGLDMLAIKYDIPMSRREIVANKELHPISILFSFGRSIILQFPNYTIKNKFCCLKERIIT